MRYLIVSLVLLIVPIASLAVDTEIVINGPNFGIGTNLDEDYLYSEDNPLMKAGRLNIKIYKDPLYLSFFTVIEEYGSFYSPTTPDFSMDEQTNYSGMSGSVIAAFRLFGIGPVILSPAVSAGYHRLDYDKSKYGYYYDYVNDESERALTEDKGDYTELILTGGALFNIQIGKFFQSDNYCGFGFSKIENSSIWKMALLFPPHTVTATRYGYESSGFAVRFSSNNRFAIYKMFGINVGFEFTKRPASPGYGYIPESELRYSEYDSLSYAFYIGPSFYF